MALNKIKIGKYIQLYSEKCGIKNLTNDEISGINKDKEFFEPSPQVGADTSKYKIVPPGYFACNLMHVGRDVVLPIAYNHTDKNKIVSPAYQVFKFKENEELLGEYFFLYLKSPEKDRYFWFNTDSSVRDGMSWEDFVEVEIELPSLDIQKKYVNVYNTMSKNQQLYGSGLEDLKLVTEAYIQYLDGCNYEKIGKYIKKNKKRNQAELYDKNDVRGFNNEGDFIKPMRLFSGKISSFKILSKNDFVYNSRINSTISKLSVALNEGNELIVSPAYESFYVSKQDELDPYYLYMLLQRESFARKVLYNSFGSSTIVFDFDNLSEIEIPVPNIKIQRSIANLYKTYKERKAIYDNMKKEVKDAASILLKGSLEESKKEE